MHGVRERWRKGKEKKSSWSKTKNPIDEFGCRNPPFCVVHESRSDFVCVKVLVQKVYSVKRFALLMCYCVVFSNRLVW